MDYKKILMGLLSTAYKLDSEKIDAILADDQSEDQITTSLLDADKDRVTALSNKPGQTFQDGYAKAKKEVLTAFENELRAEFGVQADVTGLNLVREVIKAKAGTPGSGTLTDEEVKKHPVYQSLEGRLTTALDAKETEWKTKFDEREKQLSKVEKLAKVKSLVLTELEKLKPVLSATPTVAQTQQQNFANEFSHYEYDFQDNGRIVITKDGILQEDGHGNSLKLADLVKSRAPYHFDFKKNGGAGNAGNDNNDNPPSDGEYPAGIKRPTTDAELSAIMMNTAIPVKDRNTVMAVWEKENP